MMQRPWDCAQPDEWLPRNLRLCWGGSGSGGGFSGDSGGGGWSGDGGFASTGGGDWGSAGTFDASSFNAGGDLGAWAGTAYDASTAGTGAGAGGDWASFGPTSYGGFDAPNPTFADVAGPNPGVTTGGGDWGSAGTFSAAGTGGGPLGAMFGADTGGGSMYGGGGGGGLFGDYGGGGGGGAYTGGGGVGRSGGDAFGSFGTLAASNTGRGSEAPSPAAFTDTAGGGRLSGDAPASRSDAPTRSEAEVSSVSEADQAAPEAAPDEAAPGRGIGSDEVASPSDFGTPSETETAPESAGPGRGIGSDEVASPSESEATTPAEAPGRGIGSDEVASPSAFGPQTVTRSEPTDYQGSPYADMGPQGDTWGSVFEAPGDPAYQNDRSGLIGPPTPDPGWFQSLISDIPGVTTPAWAQDIGKSITDVNTWLAPQNQGVINTIANLPSTLNPNNWVNMQSPMGPAWGPQTSALDLQALGEQGRVGQLQDTFDSRFGLDPNTDTTNWGSVFEAPAQAPDYASVFEAPAQEPDWGSVFEGTPSSPDWGSVFEGAPSVDSDAVSSDPNAAPTYDTTMESGQPVAPTTTDDTTTIGGDPALSGLSAADAAAAGAPGTTGTPGQPGQPGTPPAGGFVDPGASPDAAVNAASIAADKAGVSPEAADAVTQAVGSAQESGANPAAVATAAMTAALDKGATQQQADAIAAAVYDAAVSQAENVVGTTPGQQPQAPPGQQVTSSAFIPGGRTTDFNYGPQAAPPPGLLEQAQPGTQAFIPGGRTTDFNYPSSTSRGIEPGAEQYGVEPEDHDAPEPADRSQPEQDPNAPRPPENIPAQPGQLLGARGTYQNQRADNPQVNRNYRDSGRTDYPQGRPGIDFRTARQAGIEPLFRTEDINTADLDARLIERINRAMQDMPAGIRDGLTASSGYRAAHRGEALEHGMDPRTSQESVYSRGHPSSGGGGFISARPGGSNHGPGRAIDFLSSPALSWLRANAGRYGLETIANDHPHIQLQGARGIAGVRPSPQEQQAQRAIDAQNRQAAIDQGLIGGGRGQAPTQQAAVPTPRARPSDAPQAEVAAQPAWGSVFEAANPPADMSPAANLPPQDPAPRPPADIPFDVPVQTMPPAPAARTERAAMQFAKFLADNLAKSGKLPSNREEGQKALTDLARELAKAGYPASVAQRTILDTATQGSIKAGYGPNSAYNALGHVTQAINEMAATAMQGYHAGKTPEAQGPPSPAPGQRSEAPFGSFRALAKGGHVADDEPVVVGEQGPEVFVPDRPGTVVPHMPQPGGPGNIDRWPKGPAVGYPGQYGGVEREIRRQIRAAQDPVPGLMDMINSGQLRFNPAAWDRWLNDPKDVALGRSRIEDRRAYSYDYPY